MQREITTNIAAANALWDSGKKAEAVAAYHKLADDRDLPSSDRLVVLQRLIDFQAEQGNTEEAKKLIRKAYDDGIGLLLSSEKAESLESQVQEEKNERDLAGQIPKEKSKGQTANTSYKVRGPRTFTVELDPEIAGEISLKDLEFANGTLRAKVTWEHPGGPKMERWHYSIYDTQGTEFRSGNLEYPENITLGQAFQIKLWVASPSVARVIIHR
jgi:hypothetical protein